MNASELCALGLDLRPLVHVGPMPVNAPLPAWGHSSSPITLVELVHDEHHPLLVLLSDLIPCDAPLP